MVFLLLFLSALGIGQARDAQLASRLVTEGLGLAEQGRHEEAAARFRMAAQADPKNVDAHNNLGVTLRRRKDFQGAAAAFQAALQLRPKDARIHSNVALAFRGIGRLDDALASMKKACSLEPRDATMRRNLGILRRDHRPLPRAGPGEGVGLDRAPRGREEAALMPPPRRPG